MFFDIVGWKGDEDGSLIGYYLIFNGYLVLIDLGIEYSGHLETSVQYARRLSGFLEYVSEFLSLMIYYQEGDFLVVRDNGFRTIMVLFNLRV